MGSESGHTSERPAHRVTIARPFGLGKYEVTVAEWQACVDAGGCGSRPAMRGVTDTSPVHNLSWDDARAYVVWLAEQTGQPYRLPTEAEWEYAARAGSEGAFWWGDRIEPDRANCADCGEPWQRKTPAAVGSFAANPLGLHDMNGGVMEWVEDCWAPSHEGAPSDGSARSARNCEQRVLRGGSWRHDASYASSTSRLSYDGTVRYYTNGIRVARDLD
jgi:formylglycine-generating enzyme required for sulfatase activity